MKNQFIEIQGEYAEPFAFKPAVIPVGGTGLFKPQITGSPLFKRHNLFLKRLVDIVIALFAIVFLLSWMLPLLALLIKLDSRGPAFFIQNRNKRGGKSFRCLKLRTMTGGGDNPTPDLHDSRITRIGKFLRKSHLDELPQFLNVLAGNMSIVGPRPHMIAENIKFNSILNYYNYRHAVKPGITGLAQSYGYHGPIADLFHLNKKVDYDIFYIQNWSPVMDFKIVFRTIGMIFNKLNPGQ
jgi:putative colanic acid biosynthesis UDP-glucose lipid carrier transferase